MVPTTAATLTVEAAPATGGATTSGAAVINPPLLISPPPFSWAAVVSGQVAGAPISPRSFSKSFHDVLDQNGPIKQKIPSTFRGEPAVFFSKEEITKLATPFRYTVIGKFCYHRPSMENIRKFFTSLGLKSLQSVGLLQQNHIAIFITQKEDYTRLMMRATWYISGAPMKVLKWSPEFYPNVESPVVPVWVGLPGLPLHFFEKSALFCIASVLGTPLKIDEPTAKLSRPTVARICVEVDVSKPRSRRIWLGDEKDGYWQEVIFENSPKYCDFCQALGHDSSSCFKKNPDLFKESKKNSGMENTKAEENRKFGHPVGNSGKEKIRDVWRRKEVDAVKDGKTDAEGWTVVENKKKNKNQKGQLTELLAGEPSEILKKVPEKVVVLPSETLGHPRLSEGFAGKVNLAISLTPLNPNRQVKISNAMVKTGNEINSQPLDVTAGNLEPLAGDSGGEARDALLPIAVPHTSSVEKSAIEERAGGFQKASGGKALIPSSNSSQLVVQNSIEIQPLDGSPFQGDNFLKLLTNEFESGGRGVSLLEKTDAETVASEKKTAHMKASK